MLAILIAKHDINLPLKSLLIEGGQHADYRRYTHSGTDQYNRLGRLGVVEERTLGCFAQNLVTNFHVVVQPIASRAGRGRWLVHRGFESFDRDPVVVTSWSIRKAYSNERLVPIPDWSATRP